MSFSKPGHAAKKKVTFFRGSSRLDTVSFLDNTDSNKEKAQRGNVAIASQTDSAYLNTRNRVELSDPKMRRRIQLA